jgi:hypothetical protein
LKQLVQLFCTQLLILLFSLILFGISHWIFLRFLLQVSAPKAVASAKQTPGRLFEAEYLRALQCFEGIAQSSRLCGAELAAYDAALTGNVSRRAGPQRGQQMAAVLARTEHLNIEKHKKSLGTKLNGQNGSPFYGLD